LDGCKFFKNTKDIPGIEEGMVQLVGLSQNPRIVGGKRFFRRTNLIISGNEDVTVKLVELPKIRMMVGGKIFKRAEGIPRVEEVK
ncbi:hypothetical protein A2U01_0085278, partial [Trifolium medium]|nr:hypothetical protein [Trifolium medium]